MNRKIIAASIAIIWLLSAMVSFVPISLGWHRPPTPVSYSTITTATTITTTATTTASTTSITAFSSSILQSTSSTSSSSSYSSSSPIEFLLSNTMVMDSLVSTVNEKNGKFQHLNHPLPRLTSPQGSSQVSISPSKMINQSSTISPWKVTNDSESVKLQKLSKFILPFTVQSFDSHMKKISPSSSSSSSSYSMQKSLHPPNLVINEAVKKLPLESGQSENIEEITR